MADLTDDVVNKLIDSINALNRNVLKGTSATEKNTKAEEKANKTNGGGHSPSKTGDAKVIQDVINENKKLASAISGVSKKYKSLDTGANSTIKTFQDISRSASSASGALKTLGAAFGVGGVLKTMIEAVSDTTKTYQELSQYGQTFGGSMLAMQQAAANAALPLSVFADALKKNNTVVAAIGANAFGSMSKALRTSLMDVGQLGLTSAQLNTNLGTYLDTQRLFGNLNAMSQEKAVANTRVLAVEMAKASAMTGAFTENILKASNEALRDETLRAKMLQMGSSAQDAYGQSLNKAVIYMSALPGEAGKTLSKMLAQTAGSGSAIMSDASQTFIDAGLFGVTSLMDNMAQKVANGTFDDQAAADFNRKFVAEGMKNMATLQFQASTGNKAAKEAIVMISEMKELASKSPEELAKTKNVTKFLENLGVIIDKISGTLRTGFFNGLENLMKGFDTFADSPAFNEFTTKLSKMAEDFGLFLSKNLTPEKLIAFGEGLAAFTVKVVEFGSKVVTVVDAVASTFGWLTDKLGLFGAALVAWAAWQTMKMAGGAVASYGGRIKDLLSEKFKIGGGANRENQPITGNEVQGAFERALSKFSAGSALRVIDIRGDGGGGNDFGDNERGKKGKKGRRTRRTGRGRGRVGNMANILEEGAHRLPTPHPPPVPEMGPPRPTRMQRFERMNNSMHDFRGRASTNINRFARSPVSSTRAGLSRGYSAARGGATRAAGATRAGASRLAGVARGGGAKVAGGLMKGGAGMLRGGASLLKGIGPGALIGGAASLAIGALPEFKGKETLQTMAEFAAMGSMLGPIGAAVGAGVGALYANWDSVTDVVSDSFSAIKNFDYAGTLKSAGSMIGSIGTAIGGGAMALWGVWGSVGDAASKGFNAIKDFDYSGAFNKATDALGPIGSGIKWYVGAVSASWKKIGGWLKKGWSAITGGITGAWKSLMGGNDSALDSMNKAVQPPTADIATPITQKFDDYSKTVTGNFSSLTDANTNALATISAPVDLATSQNVDLFGATNPATSSVAGPSTPTVQTVPELNTDALVAQQSEYKLQSLQMQKENLETKNQMMQMMGTLQSGTQQQVGGMRDMISEQQKSNRNLDTVAGNVI